MREKLTKCKICQKYNTYDQGLCKYCYDVRFYLKEIIDDYFKGPYSDDDIVNALGNFSWIYAGYPRFWGYYNAIINTIYHFIMNIDKDYITENDLKYFEFTKVDKRDILIILFESKTLETPKPGLTNTIFKAGKLTQILVKKIRNELITDKHDESNRKRFKKAATEMFGIVSIILTYILMEKKFEDPKNQWLPRKALSVFLTLVHIILKHYNDPEIPKEFSRDLLDEQHSVLKLTKDGRLRIMLEMLGLTYITPGKTNIISNVDKDQKSLMLNDEMVLLLERLRERRRARIRTRNR